MDHCQYSFQQKHIAWRHKAITWKTTDLSPIKQLPEIMSGDIPFVNEVYDYDILSNHCHDWIDNGALHDRYIIDELTTY